MTSLQVCAYLCICWELRFHEKANQFQSTNQPILSQFTGTIKHESQQLLLVLIWTIVSFEYWNLWYALACFELTKAFCNYYCDIWCVDVVWHYVKIIFIAGNFSGQRNHEIVVAKAGSIELYRPDDTGKLISISETPVFSVVRSLLAFRLAGTKYLSSFFEIFLIIN